MKFFEKVEILLSDLGINNPNNALSSQNKLLKWKNPFVLFVINQFIIFGLFYMSIEAKRLEEYVSCFYMLISAILFLFVVASFAWNRSKLFDDLINGFDNITEKR